MTPTSAHIKVLIVDDEAPVLKAWRWMLHADDFEVEVQADAAGALRAAEAHAFHVAVVDAQMPDTDGFALMARLKALRPDLEILAVLGQQQQLDAGRLEAVGAYDHLKKPFQDVDQCIAKVREAARVRRMRALTHDRLARSEATAEAPVVLLESDAPVMVALHAQLATAARVGLHTLITGPAGAGKSLVMQALHNAAGPNRGPLVTLVPGAVAAERIEEVLFGTRSVPGVLERANGGTLALEEVGTMPLAMQLQLAQILRSGVLRRVGGVDLPVKLRVVATTVLDLPRLMDQGRFRAELLFALNVAEVQVPGLQARATDIPSLAAYFLQRAAKRAGRVVRQIGPDALQLMARYAWPGNLRELESAMEVAVRLAEGPVVHARHLPAAVRDLNQTAAATVLPEVDLDLPFREALEQADRNFRVRYLTGLMDRYRSVSAAARHAQMDRANFRRLLRRLEITDYPRGSRPAEDED